MVMIRDDRAQRAHQFAQNAGFKDWAHLMKNSECVYEQKDEEGEIIERGFISRLPDGRWGVWTYPEDVHISELMFYFKTREKALQEQYKTYKEAANAFKDIPEIKVTWLGPDPATFGRK